MRPCARRALLLGVAVAFWPCLSLAGEGIAFEDVTATSGISWERLPRDKADTKPSVPYCAWQFDVFAFDADGDGHMDLASPSHHAAESAPGGLWLGKGDGTFGPNTMDQYPVTDEKRSRIWIYAAYGVGLDVDGGRRLDFFVAEPGGSYISQGVRGEGEKRVVQYRRHASGSWRTAIFGDFNRDGRLDLATDPVLLLGGGKGSVPKDWKPEQATTELFKKLAAPTQYGLLHQGVSANVDRDGSADLVINASLLGKGKTGPRPRALLFINDGKGIFSERSEAMGLTDGPPRGPLVAADLDSDGYFDIVAAGRGNGLDDQKRKIRLYVNEAGKRFAARDGGECGLTISDTADYNIVYCSAVAVDLDNDGLLDLVLGDALKRYRVFRNLSHFRFQEVAILPPGARMARPATADLNEDGLMDLVVTGGKVGLTMYLNRTRTANGWLEVARATRTAWAPSSRSSERASSATAAPTSACSTSPQRTTTTCPLHLTLAWGTRRRPMSE